MASVNFKRIEDSANINSIDIEDGAFIVTGDGKTYVDYGTDRIPTSGTPDDEMSDTSHNTVENKVIKEYVDNNTNSLKPTLLWTNPSPSNNFSSSQITLSRGDYDFLEIYYYEWSGDSYSWKDLKCAKVIKGYTTVLEAIISYNSKGFIGARRVRYINATTLQVDTCYSLILDSAFSTTSVDAFCVPVKIYGYKYS